ncbi:hypothetical protein HII31_06269 [Pseudocercospora fuligena]|uniref:Uncharacterized protein n=1 Tax=Pseudocercospora fuligena TaxID=685502 RepID=A0A8H6VJ20_9PEZI|nr:hypothetical protein HII31_06269 [Pseudocercospora fuligena]
MWMFLSLLIGLSAAQSPAFEYGVYSSNTCVKRSVIVYTSESSTYFVTDIGSTSFAATSTFCPNATVSTEIVTTALPPSTITIYQQGTPSATGGGPTTSETVLSDTGFEGGNDTPFNSSASSPQVTASVVSSSTGPLPAYDGDNYLLITFGTSSSGVGKRQAAASQTYNVTSVYAANAGSSYTFSAYAAQAQNGDVAPQCSLTICGNVACSAAFPLTASYSQYSYQYTAQSTRQDATATFIVQCAQAAYVALDSVSVVANTPGSSGQATQTVTQTITPSTGGRPTQTVTQTVDRTVTATLQQGPSTLVQTATAAAQTSVVPVTYTTTRLITTTLDGSTTVLTTTVPTVILSTIVATASPSLIPITQTETQLITTSLNGSTVVLTSTVPTVIWSTVYATATPDPQTITFDRTATTVAWTTATQTATLNQTIDNPITTTTTITSTLNVTTTQPASIVVETSFATATSLVTYTAVSSYPLNASTSVTTATTTLLLTTTIDRPSIINLTTTATETSILTETRTPFNISVTYPQVTLTPLPTTELVTITLDPSTITNTLTETPLPVTETSVQSFPAVTNTLNQTHTLTNTFNQTFTATFSQTTTFTYTQNVTMSLPYTIGSTDIDYLLSSGQDFCTSFMSYAAPTTWLTQTQTPTQVATRTSSTGITASVTGATITQAGIAWKRQEAEASGVVTSPPASIATPLEYTTVDYVPPYSAVILASTALVSVLPNGTDANNDIPISGAQVGRRQFIIPTPTSIAGWPSCLISQACAAIATGTFTATSTTEAPSSTTVQTYTSTSTTQVSPCPVPSQLPDYLDFTPIYGTWVNQAPGTNPSGSGFQSEVAVQFPMTLCIAGRCNSVLTIGTDGYLYFTDSWTGQQVVLNIFRGMGLYLYGGGNGIYYRITGSQGSRQIVISWFASTYQYGHETNHFTVTFFEGSGTIQLKYFDVVQVDPRAYASISINGATTSIVQQWMTFFQPGWQYTLTTNSGSTSVGVAQSTHSRIDCCTKGGWHSCTEFQPAQLDPILT